MKSNIDDQCLQKYKALKFGSLQARYIVYKIDSQKVVVQAIGGIEKTWQSFLQSLPPKQYRMCVYKLEFVDGDNVNRSKLIFVYWAADGTPLKIKLLYATFKEALKTSLDIGGKQIIVCSSDEMTFEELVKQFNK